MKIKILESAIEDLHCAREFYARHGVEVGDYYLDTLFSDIDSLLLYAGIHELTHGYYRLLSKRFPYAVYYTLEGETVIVYRVLDLRRNPTTIRNQLSDVDRPTD